MESDSQGSNSSQSSNQASVPSSDNNNRTKVFDKNPQGFDFDPAGRIRMNLNPRRTVDVSDLVEDENISKIEYEGRDGGFIEVHYGGNYFADVTIPVSSGKLNITIFYNDGSSVQHVR